eukprot:12886035-Prorocentrum_lima.AAC.1
MRQAEHAVQFELQSELQAKSKLLDGIKKKSVSSGELAQKYLHQACDFNNKLDDLEKKHLDDVANIQAHIEVQGHEEALLRAQFE